MRAFAVCPFYCLSNHSTFSTQFLPPFLALKSFIKLDGFREFICGNVLASRRKTRQKLLEEGLAIFKRARARGAGSYAPPEQSAGPFTAQAQWGLTRHADCQREARSALPSPGSELQ